MTEREIRQRLADRLQAFDDRFQALIRLVHDTPLSRPDQANAQTLLKELKESLKEASRGTKDTRHPYSRLFHSEVSQALGYLKVRTNSVPSEKWIQDLGEAQVNIRHALSRCKEASEA